MNLKFAVAGVLAACACAGVAAADDMRAGVASVVEADGKVMVNAGKGFAPATLNLVLKAGDRVLVGENSFATLSFETCTLALSKPSVFTVSETPPCDAAQIQPVADLPGGGGAYPPGGAGLPPAAGAAAIPPFVTTLAFVGPLAVACAVKCGDLLDNEEVPTTAR